MYLAYSILLGLGLLLASPYFLWKGRGTGKYLRSFTPRLLGVAPKAKEPSLWIHAVSVGEVLAARPLVAELRRAFPTAPLFLSTTTLTGQRLAQERLATETDGVFFAPFDFAFSVRRALRHVEPRLLILVETEIWPNLVREARRHGARVAIVNGRLSLKSFARYRRLGRALWPVLRHVDLFLMQGEGHAERIRALGAPPDRVSVLGNLKYDALDAPPPAAPSLADLLLDDTPAHLWVAGSTVEGEETMVLEAFAAVRERLPGARLLVAPRRPERFAAVAQLVERHGFTCVRRSALSGPPADRNAVVVLDTLGELACVYSLASVVFVGGSLVGRGGHNILEPAAAGKAIVVGPHMENFQEMADLFRGADAFVEVRTPAELSDAVARLLIDPASRERLGERGRLLLDAQKGAARRTVEALRALLT